MGAPILSRANAGRGHTYRDVNALGKIVERWAGVTTILGEVTPPRLAAWASKAAASYMITHWDELAAMDLGDRYGPVADAHWGVRNKAAARGTDVHGYGQRLVAGEPVEVSEALWPLVEAYAQFLSRFKVTPVLVERPVVHRALGYAGTFDLIADIGGTRWLLDLKTGAGLYRDTALQLVAYRNAEVYLAESNEELSVPAVDRCGVVHVGSDEAALIPVEAGPAEWETWQHYVAIYNWIKGEGADPYGLPLDVEARAVG